MVIPKRNAVGERVSNRRAARIAARAWMTVDGDPAPSKYGWCTSKVNQLGAFTPTIP